MIFKVMKCCGFDDFLKELGNFSYSLFVCSETGSLYVAQAGLELPIFLPPPPKQLRLQVGTTMPTIFTVFEDQCYVIVYIALCRFIDDQIIF
jgi:hypothetical protein